MIPTTKYFTPNNWNKNYSITLIITIYMISITKKEITRSTISLTRAGFEPGNFVNLSSIPI